jgi:AAA family ATP:ADP antiporter
LSYFSGLLKKFKKGIAMASLLGGMFTISGFDKHERLKFFLLTLAFAFVIGSYTIAKELKDSIFVSMVGKDYLPTAKLLVIFILIPAALIYARIVDWLRRYQVLAFYSLIYGIILGVFTILLGHKTMGLYNTDASCYRLFGWFFYCFLEGYSPFVVSVFWAYLNSVCSPVEAKNGYPLMVAGSKIGGILAAFFAWYLLNNVQSLNWFGAVNHDVLAHQILMGIVSVMLLCIPLILYLLLKYVPGQYLHGYEAVYQMEKKQEREHETGKMSMLAGIQLLFTTPYVLGIFGLVFFYETLNVVLGFQRICLLQAAATSIADLSAAMFWQRLIMHAYGMVVAFFGVQFLVRKFEVRRCLFMVPLIVSGLLMLFLFTNTADTVSNVFIWLGVINYSLSVPLRETLYIPATKNLKFKAKAWIDSFGTKFSKGFGSCFASITRFLPAGSSALTSIYVGFFSMLMLLWFITAWLLGKKYERAVRHNQVIGNE